jgi:hypothetical protein
METSPIFLCSLVRTFAHFAWKLLEVVSYWQLLVVIGSWHESPVQWKLLGTCQLSVNRPLFPGYGSYWKFASYR